MRCAMSSATPRSSIVIANTKGFTGHAMGTGIEEVVAVKALETGCVPPVANFKEVDPELGPLNLSKGGVYPDRVRAAAGRRVRIADQHDADALGDCRRTGVPARMRWDTPIASPIAGAWHAWLSRMAGHPARNWKWCTARCACGIKGRAARSPKPLGIRGTVEAHGASATAPAYRRRLRSLRSAATVNTDARASVDRSSTGQRASRTAPPAPPTSSASTATR